MSRAPVILVLLTSPDRYLERYGEPDKAASGLGHPRVARDADFEADDTDVDNREQGGVDAWPVPYWFFDAGTTALILLLAARDAGLGACLLGNFRGEKALLSTFGVPDGWRYAGAVLLGEPGGEDPRSPSLQRGRRPAEDTIHWGQW
jgi:nitroreductase